ncbi:MAG: uL30 family ribosomal protein [Candidatus Aenigmatarchaeota archaeon]
MTKKKEAGTPAKSEETGRILVIRLRGEVGVKGEIEDTMQMLGLKRRYWGAVLERKPVTLGMIKKVENFVAWGEPSAETLAALGERIARGGFGLKPPAGGLTSVKLNWPNGDLGYRGADINELVKRMM